MGLSTRLGGGRLSLRVTTLRGYRLFNVAEPTRPPYKKYIPKGDGTPEKGKGGFSITRFQKACPEKCRGVGGVLLCKRQGGVLKVRNLTCILIRVSMGRSPDMHLGGGGTGGSGLADFINTLLTFCIILKSVIIKSWEMHNALPEFINRC
jgi:hypothetical protein